MSIMDNVSLTIHHILRYSFGGLLFWLIAGISEPAKTRMVADALGAVGVALTAFALGAVAYVAARVLLIYPFISWLRAEEAIYFLVEPKGKWSRRHFFEASVRPTYSAEAWRVVRDSGLIDRRIRQQIHLQHSENHIPYIAAAVCAISGFALVVQKCDWSSAGILAAVAIASFLVGLINDAQMSYQEGSYLRALPDDKKAEMESRVKRAEFPRPV